MLYYAQGRQADAEPLYKRSLATHEKALGPQHPNVATSLNNLASLYKAQGRHADAEPLYKRSLAIREKALGPEHPDIAMSLDNYAALLRKTGRAAEAARMEARAKTPSTARKGNSVRGFLARRPADEWRRRDKTTFAVIGRVRTSSTAFAARR